MAGADYYRCDHCGRKTFYDHDVDYAGAGQMLVLCHACTDTHELVLIEKPKRHHGLSLKPQPHIGDDAVAVVDKNGHVQGYLIGLGFGA